MDLINLKYIEISFLATEEWKANIPIITTINHLETIIIQKATHCQPTYKTSNKYQMSMFIRNEKY